VVFAVSTVLPALEEVVPKLAAHSASLAGARIAGREYSRCTVRDVTLTGLTLQEQTQHGMILRNLPWQRLEDPLAVLLQLSRSVAVTSDTWAARRPWLALLLFSGNGKLLEDAVTGLPETPERAEWERLRAALGRAPGEGKALRLWQRAGDARSSGECIAAYRLLMELRATQSQVAARYAERTGHLLAELSAAVPDVAGGRLLREAGDLAGKDPPEALVRLLLASNRYGDADFPEKARAARIRRTALAELPLADWLLQQVRQRPLLSVVPFAVSATSGIPVLAIRLYHAASEGSADLVPRLAEVLPILEGPALLELGDWGAAARLETKFGEAALAGLPGAARAAAWFSRGLTGARYGAPAEKSVVAGLLRCVPDPATGDEGQYAMLAQALALEYGLFLRCGESDLALYLAGGRAPSPRGPAGLRARVLLGLAALALDRGQSDAGARLVPALVQPETSASDWGLSEAEVVLLKQALAPSRDAQALGQALARLPDREADERHLRLTVSAALGRDPLADELWLKLSEWVNAKGVSFGPVGGTAVYDVLLARIGQRLALGDRSGAEETVSWTLSLSYPCLAPYYARLLFIRWGLVRLRGPAGVRDLAEQVDAAAAANRVEKALGRLFVSDAARGKAREASRDSAEGRFWYDWLNTCEALGLRASQDEAGKPLERLAAAGLPRSEQILAAGLAQWAARPVGRPGTQSARDEAPK
jgi:hypothetical protein